MREVKRIIFPVRMDIFKRGGKSIPFEDEYIHFM